VWLHPTGLNVGSTEFSRRMKLVSRDARFEPPFPIECARLLSPNPSRPRLHLFPENNKPAQGVFCPWQRIREVWAPHQDGCLSAFSLFSHPFLLFFFLEDLHQTKLCAHPTLVPRLPLHSLFPAVYLLAMLPPFRSLVDHCPHPPWLSLFEHRHSPLPPRSPS